MLLGSALAGIMIGSLGYVGKELVKDKFSKKGNELKEDEIDQKTWNDIWTYNDVKVKYDDECKIPVLLGNFYIKNGIKYLFRYPIGISSEKMKKCTEQIKELSNADKVEVSHYKDDLVYITVTKKDESEIEDIPNEIKEEANKWAEFWKKAKRGVGSKEEGFEFPTLVKIESWESGYIYYFKMPVGLSTHTINGVDVAIKEYLGASRIEIYSFEKGSMQIKSYMKPLPKMVEYEERIPREKRDELEAVIGKSHKGWKRLRLLSGTHNLFVGGAVGTGKSVFINALITDYALNYKPNELEMWIMDLKIVEMAHFRNLKHVKKYGETVQEMMNMIDELTKIMWDRYNKMKEKGVKKISAYNKLVPKEERMPYILFVVEEIYEFSSSKLASGKGSGKGKGKGNSNEEEQENYIDKLATLLSKCRGAGIGAVVSSQRLMNAYIPRNVSANLMNRACFKVADSKESSLLTDDKFDATTLRGNGHGCLIDVDVEEFQGFFIDEDKSEITALLEKHNLFNK